MAPEMATDPFALFALLPPEKEPSKRALEKGSDAISGAISEKTKVSSPLFCMPRRPRFVLPGVPHHVTQRGNNRQPVFFSDEDRIRYLHLLREYSRRYESRILGWCLMTNHVHLIVIPGTPESLALTLRQTHSNYSIELNRDQGWVGHLWQNRFFSCPLDPPHLLAALS